MLFTLHGNGSTHHIYILLYDSHPQSNSMVLRSHIGIFLCKFLKNFFCKFLTHANTSIRNAVTHIYISIPALFLTPGFKCNRPSIRSEFHGIAQNIDQHITQACIDAHTCDFRIFLISNILISGSRCKKLIHTHTKASSIEIYFFALEIIIELLLSVYLLMYNFLCISLSTS